MAEASEMEELNGSIHDAEVQPLRKKHTVIPMKAKQVSIDEAIKLLACLPKQPLITLAWEDVTYSVKQGWKKETKIILKNLCGKCNPGELVGIMGPSGAGKTSLMNILTGYVVRGFHGRVLVNGQDRIPVMFRKIASYITHDDHLMGVLNVEEGLMVAANLKIPESISLEKKKQIVSAIISLLDMEDSKKTKSSALSSGQKKRLCIGMELVSNPPILFLDEPTSGLDSTSSLLCVSLLNALARSGRTIICTIHQPSASIFEKFDKLYLIANGYCVYDGFIKDVVPHFENHGFKCPPFHNPADYILEICSGDAGEDYTKLIDNVDEEWRKKDFASLFEMKEFAQQNGDLTSVNENGVVLLGKHLQEYPTSGWNQFWIILKRSVLAIFRDPILTHFRFGVHLFLGIIVGFIYYGIGDDAANIFNNAAFLFLSLLLMFFTSAMPTLLVFPLEKYVFFREHHNGWYSTKAYYLAKSLAELPSSLFFPFLYCAIVYYMTDQRPEYYMFLLFCSVCVYGSLICQSFCMIIGAAARVDVAIFLAPTLLMVFMIFSGFFVSMDQIPKALKWMAHLSFIKYSYEAIFVVTYGFKRGLLRCSKFFCLIQSPKYFLKFYGLDKAELYMDFIILTAFFIVFRIMGYLVLKWKLRQPI